MSSTYDAAMGHFEEAGIAPDTDQLDGQGNPVPMNQAPEVSAPEVTENQPTEPVTPVEPNSHEIDLSGLPEEAQIFIRAREREMQAGFTRKMQEAAEAQKQAEQYVQFVNALNSDPQFARQVAERLNQQLGMSQQAPSQEDEFFVDEDDQWGGGPDPYQQRLDELAARQEAWEQQFYQAQESARMDREIAEIRSQVPTYSDTDIQDILDIGWATNGDIHAAHEIYKGIQDRVLSRYLTSKKGVQAPGVLPNAGGAPAPEDLKDADDLTLRAVAQERLLNALGQE
jgi:hypothetical protein